MDNVAIVGGGIGGLAAALALIRRGIEVNVYEQAPELRELGAGVQISANGTRVLHALGLKDALEKVQVLPAGKAIRLWNTGQSWKLFDLGLESVERYGFPYTTLFRSALLADDDIERLFIVARLRPVQDQLVIDQARFDAARFQRLRRLDVLFEELGQEIARKLVPLAALLILLRALAGEFAEDFVQFRHARLVRVLLPSWPGSSRPSTSLAHVRRGCPAQGRA